MKLERLIFLDTETTGVDPIEDHLLEVAYALWDVPHRSLVTAHSFLMVEGAMAPKNDAEKINNIPLTLFANSPLWREASLRTILQSECSRDTPIAFVAHNAEFDRKWVPSIADLCPWICSQDDLPFPRFSASKSLVNLCLAHGVGVSSAHRALDDVLSLVRLFERVAEIKNSGFEEWLALGLRPKAKFAMAERGFDPARNELAKEHGFRWDPKERIWARSMALEDAEKLPFRVERVS